MVALAVLRKSVHYPRRDMFLLFLFWLLSQQKKRQFLGVGVVKRGPCTCRAKRYVGTEGWHMLLSKITKTSQIVYKPSIMYMIKCGIDDFIKF